MVQALRFEAGWTYQRIAENQNLAITTVSDICHAPATPKKRIGRPFSITPTTRRVLVATATRDAQHRQMTLADIADICGVRASEKTLRKAFALEGYHRRKHGKSPCSTRPRRPNTFNLPYRTKAGPGRIGNGLSGRMNAMCGCPARVAPSG